MRKFLISSKLVKGVRYQKHRHSLEHDELEGSGSALTCNLGRSK